MQKAYTINKLTPLHERAPNYRNAPSHCMQVLIWESNAEVTSAGLAEVTAGMPALTRLLLSDGLQVPLAPHTSRSPPSALLLPRTRPSLPRCRKNQLRQSQG